MLCCFSATTYDVITFLICIIQKREYLQNEKRYAKKENAIPLHSDKPFKQAAIIFYFIGTLTKHRKAKKGRGWTKLEKIEMDCVWVNLKNVGPPFFKFTVDQFIHVSNVINTAGKSFSVVTWP